MNDTILNIKDLVIHYETDEEVVEAVNNISLEIKKGEVLGLVGETGAGKTTTALGIMGLLPERVGHVIQGRIEFEGENLLEKNSRAMRKIRGQKISMIFQDPMTALNPVKPVGEQIAEVVLLHEKCSKAEALRRAQEMLEMVGIVPERYKEYPHQFSGGMKQRIVIAIALACKPDLLIADEPTTALDVTIQAQILDMMRTLQKEHGTSMILITHDLGVVAEMCDKCAVMYGGEIVEYGTLEKVFDNPQHPYTKALYRSMPSLDKDVKRLEVIPGLVPDPSNLPSHCSFYERCSEKCDYCCQSDTGYVEVEPGHFAKCLKYSVPEKFKNIKAQYENLNKSDAVTKSEDFAKVIVTENQIETNECADSDTKGAFVQIKNLKKYFQTPRGSLHAVDNVNLDIEKGKTIGIVGESGCGKSTLGKTLMRLHLATEGEILFDGVNIVDMTPKEFKKDYRKRIQMIFQDPYASLDPRMSVLELIEEPVKVHNKQMSKAEITAKAQEMMEVVGLAKRLESAYPHELDGGRRQRIGIARALSLNPDFIVCDEPVSALDVSIQAQILNLLQDLQETRKLTYMFITHDMSVVKHISDDIAVMYLGQVVEKCPSKEIFKNTVHPYSQALLSAIPIPNVHIKKERIVLEGELTSPIDPKKCCRFAARCPYATDDCRNIEPELREMRPNHFVACHYAEKFM